jgi:hypothetical protein
MKVLLTPKLRKLFPPVIFLILIVIYASLNYLPKTSACEIVSNKSISNIELRRDSGEVLSKSITFRQDGSIEGYSHPNEFKWSCANGELIFHDSTGVKTSSASTLVKNIS